MDPLDEEISRGREGMDRELHPADTYDDDSGTEGRLSDGAPAEENTPARHGEALAEEAATPPQLPGDAGTGASIRPPTSRHVTDLVIIHPSQTRFTCPDTGCRLTYPTHASLVRHVGVSHRRMTLNISFKCALCDYAHANKRSTSLHFRHAHGAAVPPASIEGSNEKACPYCPLTFPTKRSCSTHMREKHMQEVCAQRAREAADKEVQRGTSTARAKWTEREVKLFKTALAKYGPDSNIKLAAEIQTRSAAQVNVFKWRFLKAYPSWLSEHYHPAPPAGNVLNSRRASSSPRSPPLKTPEDRSPSVTQAPRTLTGARPATARIAVRSGRGTRPATAVSSSPSSQPTISPPGPQLAARPAARAVTSPSLASPEAGVALQPALSDTASTPMAHSPMSPPHNAPRPSSSSEERTPSPAPVQLSEAGVARVQRLDRMLQLLRPQTVSSSTLPAGTTTPIPTPPTAALASTAPAPLITPDTLRMPYIPGEGIEQPSAPTRAALVSSSDNLYDPPSSVFHSLINAPPLTPEMLHLEAPTTSPESAPVLTLPSSQSFLDAQPFIPGTTWTSTRVQRLNQPLPVSPALGGANPPTPPSSPDQLPPSAGVPSPPATITIDPERMDETLRMSMYQELTPFSGRRLGTFEWVAFEEVLKRWSTAIKEVVTAQRRRPPNSTSQWARRRRRRAREREGRPPSPSPDPDLPPDPSQQTGEQEQTQNHTNTRASGRARQAAKARHLQRLYRA
ncbi:hypothetical protein EMCRGX_G005323 [Ephydatia muelleri]